MLTSAKIIIAIFVIGLTACQAKEQVIIQTPSGNQAVFAVDVAKTPEEQQKGLMFVENMPTEEGMLFVYPSLALTKFWMKNTLIPLDMLFFDENNILTHIEHSAIPHDETPIGPNTRVCSVLEINGGLAKEMNITKGSKLITNITQECLQSAGK